MTKSILKIAVISIFLSFAGLAVFYFGLKMWGTWHDEWSGYNAGQYVSDGYCNIAVVPIDGEITTFPYVYEDGTDLGPVTTNISDTMYLLGRAESDPNIRGILTLIDSGGGSPAGSQFITEGLKNSSMPTVAYILDIGASGAYLIATGADTIIANPFADVGSIGISMSYLDNTKQNKDSGLEFISLSSGKFKDSGTPDKPLTAEERALFERDLKMSHEEFVKEVAENRKLPIEDVAKLADGSTLPASLALEHKLIDAVGSREDVRAWFAKQLDMATDEVVFCE